MKRVVSPLGFVVAAALLGLAFGVAHALDLRPNASILSGTTPPGAGGAVLGLVYVALYFAAVVVAPIFAIGAGAMAILERVAKRRSS